jgi:Skp family chaperone for outer membrane proteins
MRTPTALLTGALVAAASLAGGSALAARTPPPACAVAVVDLARVFSEHARAKKFTDDLEKRQGELKVRVQKEEADLKKQAQDLEVRFEPGSEEYEKGRKAIELRIAELDYDLKRQGVNLQRQLVVEMAAVYKEVRAEAERIAKERGFTVALVYDREEIRVEERGQVLGPNELKLQMNLRSVLWADASVDLTQDVLAALKPK